MESTFTTSNTRWQTRTERFGKIGTTIDRTFFMKRISMLATCLVALIAASFAATSKEVSYPSGEETVKGILYSPAGKGPFPAIVVIHGWWGLNHWVKEQAAKLADLGICGPGD
jgi:dipeptidyl aminopeptidase/acylaminoacyl peptidase